MRPLTLEAYKLLYYISGAKKFSYCVTLAIMAVMHVIVLNGLALLMSEIAPTEHLLILFRRPYFIVTGAMILVVNIWRVPFKMLFVVEQMPTKYIMLVLYIFATGLIFGYTHMIDRYF